MSSKPPVYAVIVAGGSGQRMGANKPKQFLDLNGKPLICYSILAFLQAFEGIEIILVLPENHLELGKTILLEYGLSAHVTVRVGGATRFDSVAAGLSGVKKSSIVMVHDGARPLVGTALIQRCYEGAILHGNAIPVIPVTDSIRKISGAGNHAISREDLRIVQTPQVFKSELLIKAFSQPYQTSFTDEASVAEHLGEKIFLVDGDKQNLKITTPEDLQFAEAILKAR